MFDNISCVKLFYDEINSRAYRKWLSFYSEPYSKSLSEKVKIKYQNKEGEIEERMVYVDKVAQTLTNYAQALGVESKGELYVKDNPFYSYTDVDKDTLYLYFNGIGSLELTGVDKIIQSADCENIIIDIRNNPGGVFDAVNQYLYPYLYADNIETDYVWYMPKTEYTKKMTNEWKARRKLAFRDSDYWEIGIDGKQQIYKESTKEIRLTGGKNQKDYNVYVLTSGRTGSAADTLANVLKENDAAILVGNSTGGEGLMSSFLVDYLPESGIVFTYVPELAFNEEGKNNSVYGTSPHYYVNEASPNLAEYEARGEDPYTYENRLEWDTVLNKTISLIED